MNSGFLTPDGQSNIMRHYLAQFDSDSHEAVSFLATTAASPVTTCGVFSRECQASHTES
jgi:hypothetical protein